jgi:DNA-directed RNA polymerase subunit beta'
MLIGECLPKSHTVPFATINKLLTKKEIGDVIDTVYRHTGQKDTVLFADAIMALGFRHAFKAGISFGKDDMIIPDSQGSAGSTRPRRWWPTTSSSTRTGSSPSRKSTTR